MNTNQIYLLILSWLVIVFFTTSRVVTCAEPVQLRVLSYNIHHGAGIDRKLDLPRIAKVIRSANPDIVALQEVDQNAARTGSVDQPGELAELTKMQVAFGANIELQGGYYGNAILSKHPITEFKNHLLPNLDGGERRGVLAAEIALPTLSRPLLVLGTHFDHRRDDQERVLSAEKVNSLFAVNPRPAILMGDFNDVIDSKTLKVLSSKWKPTNPSVMPTIPVGDPNKQIDFVLVRPFANWKIIETRVLDEAVASDHRAIYSVLELNERAELVQD